MREVIGYLKFIMIKKINRLIKHPLFGGSATMLIGSNVANATAYLYHLVVGRLLGPSSYGELSAVLSVLGLLFTSFNFLGLVIVKFVSSAKESEIYFIFNWFTKKTYIVGLTLGIILLLINPFLSSFLHLDIKITLLIIPIVIFAFLAFVYRSFAQGLLKFWVVVISTNIDMLIRILLGVLLIYIGFSVFGAVFALVVSMFVSYLYLKKYVLKYIKKGGSGDIRFASKVFKYSIPILFATLTTNSLFTSDVILVKHFFSSHDAGIYASLSTLGRIIFYGTGPIAAVMFPMIAKRYSNKQKSEKIFYLSLLLTFALSAVVLMVYYLFPELSIKILFGSKYLDGSPYLFLFGIFMTLFALSSLIFNYFLSVEQTKVVYISIIISLFQILGIVIWHKNIFEVISVSIYSTLLFLIALCSFYLYYRKLDEKRIEN